MLTPLFKNLHAVSFFNVFPTAREEAAVGIVSGAWMGGLLYERTGSYDVVWWLSILFGVMSALLNLPIVEKPVARPAEATA